MNAQNSNLAPKNQLASEIRLKTQAKLNSMVDYLNRFNNTPIETIEDITKAQGIDYELIVIEDIMKTMGETWELLVALKEETLKKEQANDKK